MLSPEECRRIDPSLKDLSDEELEAVLKALYGLGRLAFDLWSEGRDADSRNPLGSPIQEAV